VDVIDRAAVILRKHLASYGDGKGIELVGGDKWWLIRGRELEAEWIEVSFETVRAFVLVLNITRLPASTSASTSASTCAWRLLPGSLLTFPR
jgi:hypothetical protein